MKNRKKIFVSVCALLSLWGCDTIFDPPCREGSPEGMADVNLLVDIDMNYDGEISSQTYAAYASMLEGLYDIRYIVELYEAPENPAADPTCRAARIVRTYSQIITDGTVRIAERMRIPVKRYIVLAWVDFVAKGSRDDLHYDTQNLTSVSIRKPDGIYRGYSPERDAFSGTVEANLSSVDADCPVTFTVVCPARRPFAVYRIITTDFEKYITYQSAAPYASIRPASTDVGYRYYFPMGYNVRFGKPGQFASGVGYRFGIDDPVDVQEVLVASDYVFVSSDAFYYADFRINNADGDHINSVGGVRINLKRNMVTIIRGEFLTTDHSSGGVGVDDGFEGDEIIIRID